ncbi:hypothetical protein ACLOJK_001322 [Asimina triloba]
MSPPAYLSCNLKPFSYMQTYSCECFLPYSLVSQLIESSMRPDKNPLDLNHLPEECCEDRSEGRQPAALDHENWTEAKEATRDKNKCKKRNGGKKGEDEREKVYKYF